MSEGILVGVASGSIEVIEFLTFVTAVQLLCVMNVWMSFTLTTLYFGFQACQTISAISIFLNKI